MANKFYKLIDQPNIEINNRFYTVETYNMNLKVFLETFFDKELYILNTSLSSNQIRGIVI